MAETTPIDIAHAAMAGAPADDVAADAARLRYFERLADAELFLLLEKEAEADGVSPRLFPVDGIDYALVFDREERLAEFAGTSVPYVALSGRALAGMLAGEGIGLGVNLDVAPSAYLVGPDAIDWLATTLAGAVHETRSRPLEVMPPFDVKPEVLEAISAKLALAAGMAQSAWLAQVSYADGGRGTLLAIIGAAPGAEDALTRAISNALVFSGVDDGQIDVAFLGPEDPVCARLERVGLRFDLPAAPKPARAPAAPGMDPDHPPKLR
jgi:hypothetical protein